MESTIDNSVEREHRFSANEVKDLNVRLVRSEENGGDEFPATLLDFSKKGLRLLIPVSVRFEETVNLYITCPSAGLEYEGTGQIKHIREDGVQGWQIGCFMNPPLPDSFLAFLAEASNKERRKHPRSLAFGQGRLFKQGETGFSDAFLQNISKGGFCLATADEFIKDDKVKFVFDDEKGHPVEVRADIVRTEPAVIGYLLGLRFADTKGYQLLKRSSRTKEERKKQKNENLLYVALMFLGLCLPTLIYFLSWQNSPLAIAEETKPAVKDRLDPKPITKPRPTKPTANIATPDSDVPELPEDAIILYPRTEKDRETAREKALDEKAKQNKKKEPKLNGRDDDPSVHYDPRFGVVPTEAQGGPMKKKKGLVELPEKPDSPEVTPEPVQDPAPTVDSTENGIRINDSLRMWTDDSDQYRLEASLVWVRENDVTLKSFDGTEKVVPFERLCEEDRYYIEQMKAKALKAGGK